MTAFRLLLGLVAFAAVAAFPYLAQSYSSGAPAGATGEPGAGFGPGACTACHGGSPINSGTGGVSIDAPAEVAPGETVSITVAVTNTTPPEEGFSRRQGFEAVVMDPGTAEPAGTPAITDGVNTQFAEDRGMPTPHVTHTQSGTARTSWSFAWTAPTGSALPAAVTVYAAGNAADGVGTSGDYIYTASRSITIRGGTASAPEPRPTLTVEAIRPNPARAWATVPVVLAAPSEVAVRVVDGRGRTVRPVRDGALGAGRQLVTLDVSALAAGTYFVVVETPGGRRTQPLAVVR